MNSDNFNNNESSDEDLQLNNDDTGFIFSDDVIKNYNKKRRRHAILAAFLFLVILVGLGVSLFAFYNFDEIRGLFSKSDNNISITIPTQPQPNITDDKFYDKETQLYTPAGIGKYVLPSIVTIYGYQEKEFAAGSQGSGIILTDNGYIITNAHVINDANKGLSVELHNGEKYRAEVVGSDVKTDLAVIKISKTGLVPATFGDSSKLLIGQEVIALGSPVGLNGSLTRGVVSGLNRMIRTNSYNTEMNCIQIDAAINPGNSGGALVNMYGQVIGINTSKFLDDKYDGIGFAIAFSEAKPILEQLIEKGYVTDRTRIGITFFEVDESVAELYNIVAGLHVDTIDESCDISNTDLKSGDIITHIYGQRVVSLIDVKELLEGKKPGDSVSATIVRSQEGQDDITFEIEFKLMEDTTMLIQGTEE